ncbi:J domain-containing protein, partial [Mesorhizobium sp. M8A.F.Ca.ET.208.01.1.1]
FAAANQAYEIVGDEKTRAAYDRGEIDADGKPRFQGFEGAAGGGDPFAGFRRQQGPGGAHFEFRTGRPGCDPFDGHSDMFSQIFGDAVSGARGGRGSDRRQPVQAADLNVTMDIS